MSSIFWLGFCGPDCNVIAEQGGGPDTRSSWAGSGPRTGGCPPLIHTMSTSALITSFTSFTLVLSWFQQSTLRPIVATCLQSLLLCLCLLSVKTTCHANFTRLLKHYSPTFWKPVESTSLSLLSSFILVNTAPTGRQRQLHAVMAGLPCRLRSSRRRHRALAWQRERAPDVFAKVTAHAHRDGVV